jgi:hypothetical protein
MYSVITDPPEFKHKATFTITILAEYLVEKSYLFIPWKYGVELGQVDIINS